jgi:hypothetical protein
MPESLKCEQGKDRNELFVFIPFGICVSLILILLYISGLTPTKTGELADTDCYMRLVRVTDLCNTGPWYDPVDLRSNAPYGDRSHWTRPFDVLLILGAVPISFFTDFESSLFWWGVIISPVLLIATLIVFQWSIKPIFLSKDGPFLACLILVSQSTVLHYYQAGQSDHHSLIVFVFVLSIGFTLRMILRSFSACLCYMAGAIGALSMWVSVESMVPVGITIGVLGLFWLLEGGDFLDKSLRYAAALFVVTGFNLVLERAWPTLLTLEFDRLSIVHFSVFGFIAVLWITIYVLNRHTQLFSRRANRFSSILVGVAMLALAILVSFPKFYKGPFVDVDPRVFPLFLNKISEIQPLLSGSGSLVMQVQFLSSAVICFPFLFYLLCCSTHQEKRKGWIYVSFSSIAFILVSLYQARWSVYPQVLLSIPMARLMVLMRQRGPKTGFRKTLKNLLILLLFCAGPLCLGLFAERFIKRGDSAKSHQEVSLIRICDYLVEAGKRQELNFRILTHVDFGSEILYRTQHEVIATGYHRNGPGILDTYDIMTADTDAEALKLIQKRGIDLILLCPKSTESVFYSKPGHESTFYKRLLDDTIPNWLRKVELPSDLSSSFMLFETIE